MEPRTRFRIGAWVFDPATGDLIEGGPGRRLAPPEARLLTLLADAAGEWLAGDRLRDALGEHTPADLDHGIRQLRLALGDDPAAPTCVESQPERGYRLIAEVEPLGPAPAPAPDRSAKRLAVSLAVVVGAITLFWFGPASRVAERRAEQDRAREEATNRLASPAGRAAGVVLTERPLRLAVVAIALPEDAQLARRLTLLLDGLASDFTAIDADRLGIVGPVTSGTFVDSARPPAEIGAALGADYVLSAGIRAGGEEGAFAQLIRVAGGDPLFVTRFPADTDVEAIRGTVAAGVLAAIEQASEQSLR